ncbi:MAG: UDP-N-acetylmuramate dehydrogenase [Flavobacteriales bacterium]|nr:UDP-N-acetylmuramate dehydrogenase [Flavobacteriales bacterium]
MSNGTSLRELNSFGIDASCAKLIEIHTVEDIRNYFNAPDAQFRILGGGSNVLFTQNFDGTILLNCLQGIQVLQKEAGSVYVRVASGENWHSFVQWAVDSGYGGIENLALIPGTTGAAPIQNIGAYGVEIKDVLVEVSFIDLRKLEQCVLSAEQCAFGYRDSVFKNQLKGSVFITSITLKLDSDRAPQTSYDALSGYLQEQGIDNPGIRDVFDAVVAVRRSKLPDPAVLGNAGSFFKNPVIDGAKLEQLVRMYPELKFYPFGENQYKLAAGWLIEQSGLKGVRHGQVGTHQKQALVIVNYGGATGSEILTFAEFVMKSVQKKFDVQLEPEVNIL